MLDVLVEGVIRQIVAGQHDFMRTPDYPKRVLPWNMTILTGCPVPLMSWTGSWPCLEPLRASQQWVRKAVTTLWVGIWPPTRNTMTPPATYRAEGVGTRKEGRGSRWALLYRFLRGSLARFQKSQHWFGVTTMQLAWQHNFCPCRPSETWSLGSTHVEAHHFCWGRPCFRDIHNKDSIESKAFVKSRHTTTGKSLGVTITI